MWDLIGFLTSMVFWWAGTFFGTFLLATYALRYYAKCTGITPFINDVNKLCNKFTELPIGAWVPAYVISAALWALSIMVMVFESNKFPEIWSASVHTSEKVASYAPWVLFIFLYPASILLIQFIYSAKAIVEKVNGED